MLPTPSTSHVSFATIYEPAEDSFLLLDTLSAPAETAWLHARFCTPRPSSTPLLLEVGPGSGVVVAFLTAHAERIVGRDVLAIGVDVNADACRATEETVMRALLEREDGNGGSAYLGSICGDLTTPLLPGNVDILVFNPPYVPTDSVPSISAPLSYNTGDSFSRESQLLALSYAGGARGMETTERLLEALRRGVLSERGVAYVLLCAQNRPEEVAEGIRRWEGAWRVETVGRSGRTGGWEKLVVLRIWRGEGEGEGE